MHPLTPDQIHQFSREQQCYLCNSTFGDDNLKVHDHDHFTGDYLGAAWNDCHCSTLKQYMMIYLKVDVHLLANVQLP